MEDMNEDVLDVSGDDAPTDTQMDDDRRDRYDKALQRINRVQTMCWEERQLSLQDRRFGSVSGGQWEDPRLAGEYKEKPKFEVNFVQMSRRRLLGEFKNNRLGVKFEPKDGSKDASADLFMGLYRSDYVRSSGEEAVDNAYLEGTGGGFGAWRLRAEYEDEYDADSTRQHITFEPIYDADSRVFFDPDAQKYDKSDAKYAFVIYAKTAESYEEEFGETPPSVPVTITQSQFDWNQGDQIYIAEYYYIEEVTDKVRFFKNALGEEQKVFQSRYKQDPTLVDNLIATGFREIRQRKIKRCQVMKELMDGEKFIGDSPDIIPGNNIPVIPFFAYREIVDNREVAAADTRYAKDIQRLFNMEFSRVAAISSLSPSKKPIFFAGEIQGLENVWERANVDNLSYLLRNPIFNSAQELVNGGPIQYLDPPDVPPATAALLQMANQTLKELLSLQTLMNEVPSNVSSDMVSQIHSKADMHDVIYMANMGKSLKRCAEVWLGMAEGLYVEEGRPMKIKNADGSSQQMLMNLPIYDDTSGTMSYDTSIKASKYDVEPDVGQSYANRQMATVDKLISILQLSAVDPPSAQVVLSLILMNMDGEGLGDARKYFRKKLVSMGVLPPSDEERQELEAQQAKQAQQVDPNAQYLMASAQEAQARAENAKADTILTVAKADETKANTAKTLVEVEHSKQDQLVKIVEALSAHVAQPVPDVYKQP